MQTKAKKELAKNFLNPIRYAKFIRHQDVPYLITIDEALDVIVYEKPKVSERGEHYASVYHENLLTISQIFEEFTVKTEGMLTQNTLLHDPNEKKVK